MNKLETNAVVPVSDDSRQHGNGTRRGLFLTVCRCECHLHECARVPAILTYHVQSGCADIPNTMRQWRPTGPEIGKETRRRLARRFPLILGIRGKPSIPSIQPALRRTGPLGLRFGKGFPISYRRLGIPDNFGHGPSGSNGVEPLEAPEHLCVGAYHQLIALLSLQRIAGAGRQCQHTCSCRTTRREAVRRKKLHYVNDTAISV